MRWPAGRTWSAATKSVHGLDLDADHRRLSCPRRYRRRGRFGAWRQPPAHPPTCLPTRPSDRLLTLRDTADVTFGGIAPEPSSANMQRVMAALDARRERLKLGAIIDPDGDRIRFTDGHTEISMNQFGAMAYHFLHEYKGKRGMVAKTVATSQPGQRLAAAFGEEVFEPKVGFKEFKPVIGRALVFFEESDGISIIGHTPEKDAYIGLLLALDMVMTQNKNLGRVPAGHRRALRRLLSGPGRGRRRLKGQELLRDPRPSRKVRSGSHDSRSAERTEKITEVIALDGRKMILDDGSWLMIRPSGTEPKIRFYVESRTADGTVHSGRCRQVHARRNRFAVKCRCWHGRRCPAGGKRRCMQTRFLSLCCHAMKTVALYRPHDNSAIHALIT